MNGCKCDQQQQQLWPVCLTLVSVDVLEPAFDARQ